MVFDFPVKLIKVDDEAAKTGSEIISQEIFGALDPVPKHPIQFESVD